MAYVTSNPPQRVSTGSIGGGPSLWIYLDADPHTDVDAANYFSNGDDLGLKVGDAMIVNDSNTPTSTIHYVSTVTAGGAASITAATLA